MPLLTAAVGWLAGGLLFVGLILSIGVVAARWLILPGEVGSDDLPSPSRLTTDIARIGRTAGALLAMALALVLVRQLLEFHDPFASWGGDARLLVFGTPWGTSWLWAAAVSLVAFGGFRLAATGRGTGWWVASAAILALGAFPAFTGHASGTGGLRPVTLIADTLHVWAAGGWIGGLTLVLILERRWRREATLGPGSLLPTLVPAFSRLAMVCVGLLIATGLFASWIHLPDVAALWSSRYGRILTAKLLLVGFVLALGALNWRRLKPRLGEPGGSDDLRRSAAVELLVAYVVIGVTAALVRTSPPGH
ncbi:MAG: CopD family protein [Gemmatimonadota bacterium]